MFLESECRQLPTHWRQPRSSSSRRRSNAGSIPTQEHSEERAELLDDPVQPSRSKPAAHALPQTREERRRRDDESRGEGRAVDSPV
eukprot:scaffold15081_cov123-Isochrysis_galbana.AAC.4